MPLTYSQTAYSDLTITGTSPNQQALISYSGLDYNTDIGDTIEVYNDTTLLTDGTGGSTVNYSLETTNKNVVLKTNTFTGGTTISIYRIANKTARTIDFANASVLTEADLDNSALQTFHVAQEALDTAELGITADADGTFDANNKRIKNVLDPQNPQDAATKAYVDGGSDVQTVAGLNSEIALLGTSAMATATTGHIPVLANVVEQTVNYTVTVANSKFNIQGGEYGSATETPALTLIRGYTYVFDVSDSSVATHPLVFMNGSSTLGTSDGVTTTGTAGQAGAKVTVVVSDSVTITKYSCSSHGDGMGNTITLRHDDFKEVADIASNVTSVAGISSNVTAVASNSTNINTVAGISANVTTVASNDSNITSVAGNATNINAVATNATNVNNVGSNIANVNSVATNISQVTTFADTYHTAGTTEPSGSNVTEGDLWFDTANDVLKVYDGSSWGSASSSIATVASQNEFTASNGQGTGNKYFAIVHDVGLELVFLNGVRLKRGSDYYCTNSNTSTTPIASGNSATFVRLETVPGSSDILSIMAFGQIANNLAVNTAGGTFTGGVTFEAGTTHNTGSNTFTMPTTRGTDTYVLTRDDTAGTGGTAWKETIIPPTITSITYPTESGTVPTALEASGGSDYNVKTLTITNGGTGYSGSGTLSASSGGFAGTYTESGGVINSVTITDAGQGYTSAPTVIITPNSGNAGSNAVITASILETLLINGQNLGGTSTPPTVQIQVSGSYVTFAGTVSCNATGTVVTCANVTKQASADNYTLRITHGSNNQTVTTTVNFSADPSFSTASGSLGSFYAGVAMPTQTITADSSVDWYEGTPTMPTWMTHFADGATGTSQNLTGTPTISSGNSEVQNFNIIIRDSENQSHNRDFSLTVANYPTTTGLAVDTSVSGYRIYKYQLSDPTTAATFTFTTYKTISSLEYLVIAGGGGGAGAYGGGGGAGGMRYGSISNLGVATYTIGVGEGGTAGPAGYNSADGGQGGNSYISGGSITTITSTGGGGGANANGSASGNTGGSGGGGMDTNGGHGDGINDGGTFGTATYQGHDGGDGAGGPDYGSGGGGGAGNAGGNGNASGSGSVSPAGDGGDGRIHTITGGNVTYAAGGGGGMYTPGTGSQDYGGTGGSNSIGGDGGNINSSGYNGKQGTDHTGSGGGGATYQSAYTHVGGRGGSGIVIVRFAV